MSLQMTKHKKYLLFQVIAFFLICSAEIYGQREHSVHFQNTPYELNIYRIYGKEPGKTLMLIGGIQGNEPGGFLSADSYADMSLKKGNLIVVPRANFYSIIMNDRGPNGDMNRKFTHEDKSQSMEDRIVTILKKLISESDYLLNLHDGSGYYHPTYISKWRNPDRFGQAIIADSETYRVPESESVILLKDIADRVIKKVNPHIDNELYKFHFMNTRTDAFNSGHKEQRKSATYYALTVHHIPSFGVETSKFLPTVDLKVLFHNLVINAFMEEFDIIPQSPGFTLDAPSLKYVVVSVNNEIPIVIKKGEKLNINKGDSINISHIESNYERGLSLDILGSGDINDYRKDITITKDTSMIIRKDNEEFGKIPIQITEEKHHGSKTSSAALSPEKIDYFSLAVSGNRVYAPEGGQYDVVRGETLKIVDVYPKVTGNVVVNFKGFVGDQVNNTGEDRGYDIDTGKGLLERYAMGGKGNIYQIVVTGDKKEIGTLKIRLIQPEMEYLVFKIDNSRYELLRPGESVSISAKERILLEAVATNLIDNALIHIDINGKKIRGGESGIIGELCREKRNEVIVKKGELAIAKVFIDMAR